jgi:hypothetical protein
MGGAITSEHYQLFAIGNVVAFVVAIIAIRSFITFLTKRGFKAFGWYRIVVGGHHPAALRWCFDAMMYEPGSVGLPIRSGDRRLSLVDKPLTWTSFDVVGKIRGSPCASVRARKMKVGHAGTLDPLGQRAIDPGLWALHQKAAPHHRTGQDLHRHPHLGQCNTPSYDLETEPEQPTRGSILDEATIRTAFRPIRRRIHAATPQLFGQTFQRGTGLLAGAG